MYRQSETGNTLAPGVCVLSAVLWSTVPCALSPSRKTTQVNNQSHHNITLPVSSVITITLSAQMSRYTYHPTAATKLKSGTVQDTRAVSRKVRPRDFLLLFFGCVIFSSDCSSKVRLLCCVGCVACVVWLRELFTKFISFALLVYQYG